MLGPLKLEPLGVWVIGTESRASASVLSFVNLIAISLAPTPFLETGSYYGSPGCPQIHDLPVLAY